jgi:hypothetical protein
MTPEQVGQVSRQGTYGLVETASRGVYASDQKQIKITGLVFGILRNDRRQTSVACMQFELAMQLIIEGKLNLDFIDKVPKGNSKVDISDRANLISVIGNLYSKMINERRRNGENPQYDLGLILSDFLELLPRLLAAKILLSASESDLALDAISKERIVDRVGEGPQVLALEALVLLPREIRVGVFGEMAKMEPGEQEGASMLFGQLTDNFYNVGSTMCGYSLILANLSDEAAIAKVAEVSEDFVQIGEIIRAQN